MMEKGGDARQAAERFLQEKHVVAEALFSIGASTHVFSHIKWHMRGFGAICKKRGALEGEFVDKEDFQALTVPSALKQYTAFYLSHIS